MTVGINLRDAQIELSVVGCLSIIFGVLFTACYAIPDLWCAIDLLLSVVYRCFLRYPCRMAYHYTSIRCPAWSLHNDLGQYGFQSQYLFILYGTCIPPRFRGNSKNALDKTQQVKRNAAGKMSFAWSPFPLPITEPFHQLQSVVVFRVLPLSRFLDQTLADFTTELTGICRGGPELLVALRFLLW